MEDKEFCLTGYCRRIDQSRMVLVEVFNGETEVEGALKLALKNYRIYETEYVSSVEIGEPTVENDSGVSVFLPREGEGLWQVAKRLKCSPEDVEKNNPDLVFPVKGDERILIYRCFDENL